MNYLDLFLNKLLIVPSAPSFFQSIFWHKILSNSYVLSIPVHYYVMCGFTLPHVHRLHIYLCILLLDLLPRGLFITIAAAHIYFTLFVQIWACSCLILINRRITDLTCTLNFIKNFQYSKVVSLISIFINKEWVSAYPCQYLTLSVLGFSFCSVFGGFHFVLSSGIEPRLWTNSSTAPSF